MKTGRPCLNSLRWLFRDSKDITKVGKAKLKVVYGVVWEKGGRKVAFGNMSVEITSVEKA